jgi:hypothetical protein
VANTKIKCNLLISSLVFEGSEPMAIESFLSNKMIQKLVTLFPFHVAALRKYDCCCGWHTNFIIVNAPLTYRQFTIVYKTTSESGRTYEATEAGFSCMSTYIHSLLTLQYCQHFLPKYEELACEMSVCPNLTLYVHFKQVSPI